ncbi:hypothetical protein QN277_024081 [Acacia crassicarpa]|uniref:ADP-ribosyl cyclase/cyclic ADP-ribose hydrolase n=1 Tax=Acacia crassicarpa TaxID=499986 RepID=A0AAE1MNM8_9FABA|nr:hypothetical protein QN277_024081 [Acacia crassicarpa]
MASLSQFSRIKHDVFISFCGTDTRSGFLSHLRKELRHKQIGAFLDDDDDKIERGGDVILSPELSTGIEESFVSLVIFSKNYASSTWCLKQLVKIMECKDRYQQIVIPVFYNIDPSDVRHQKGSYADALAQHDDSNYYKEELPNWKHALTKSANLSGFHSLKYGDEARLIEEIAKSVSNKLNTVYQSDFTDLVGIDERIADLESLMGQGLDDVRVIGIWGMGGIGKTTIAAAMFNRLCSEYEGCSFSANVREESKERGIIYVKNTILSALLKENDLHIGTPYGIPSYVKRRLLRKKVLVVLDDINDLDQLENLVGAFDCFGSGSRIIITTRDKEVLGRKVDKIYEVKPLDCEKALQLFNMNAFKQRFLDMEWTELSRRMVEYAKGLPLALKVLGSFLHGKTKEEWKSQLKKLEKKPFKKIHDLLRLSYNSLDRQQKEIFLYIACLFKGYLYREIIALLDACGFTTTIELKVLRDKALITEVINLVSKKPIVSMHDLIQEVGWEIVREESIKDPGKRSRLWDPDESYEVLKNNKGTEAIQSISLDMSTTGDLSLNPQVFARMHKLKFLKIFTHISSLEARVHLPQGLQFLPNELRILLWQNYPLKFLPPTFSAENLVQLVMNYSNVEKLWDGVVPLVNLKKFDLRHSQNLLALPDFSTANNLESVSVFSCKNLHLVHPSILSLQKLESLDISYCEKLTSLVSDVPLKSLRALRLASCSRLKKFSVTSENMRELDLSETAIEELPLSLGCLSQLETFSLWHCKSLKQLPNNLVGLRSLRYLKVTGCMKLQSLPELPPSVEILWASDCSSLANVPVSTDPLNTNVKEIRLANCMNLDETLLNDIGWNIHTKLLNHYEFERVSSSEDQENNQIDDVYIRTGGIYPGSKVPSWFKYRTSHQASITVSLQFNIPEAFIFCVILSQFPLSSFLISITVDCFMENNNGDQRLHVKSFDLVLPGTELNSDHVCLFYVQLSGFMNGRVEESRESYEHKLSFEFSAQSEVEQEEEDKEIVIKGCGVYPIYTLQGCDHELRPVPSLLEAREAIDDPESSDDEKKDEEEVVSVAQKSNGYIFPPLPIETWKEASQGLKDLLNL